jgi:Undecaprenyl-phosphate glucose phosphotransferase
MGSHANFENSMPDFLRVGVTGSRRLLDATWSGDIATTALVALDFFDVVLASTGVHLLGTHIGPSQFRSHLAATLLAAGIVVLFNSQFSLYDLTRLHEKRRTIGRLLVSLVLAFAFMLLAAGLADSEIRASDWKLSFVAVSIVAVVAGRLSFAAIVEQLGKLRMLARNIVVIGAGAQGEALIAQLERHGRPWTNVLCVFDDRARSPAGARTPSRVGKYPVLGTTQDLLAVSRTVRIDEIFIALPWTASERIKAILKTVRVIPANIHTTPDLTLPSLAKSRYASLDGLPVMTMVGKPVPVSGWGHVAKSILDITLTMLGLLAILPLLVLIAIAIKLDSPGPVLFRQQRLGFNNKLIDVYKFRSMYHEQRDPGAERLTTRNDPRVTRVGAILRRTSLDELPQLFNVLKGDMSLVGPRPHALKAKAGGQLYQDVVSEYALRHKIKPGITGWAQVRGWRGETDTEEKIVRRVEHDLYYIDNWSILFDLHILLLTVFSAPFHKNAY